MRKCNKQNDVTIFKIINIRILQTISYDYHIKDTNLLDEVIKNIYCLQKVI